MCTRKGFFLFSAGWEFCSLKAIQLYRQKMRSTNRRVFLRENLLFSWEKDLKCSLKVLDHESYFRCVTAHIRDAIRRTVKPKEPALRPTRALQSERVRRRWHHFGMARQIHDSFRLNGEKGAALKEVYNTKVCKNITDRFDYGNGFDIQYEPLLFSIELMLPSLILTTRSWLFSQLSEGET